MSDKRSNDKFDDLRERLYARGEDSSPKSRTVLKSDIKPPRQTWSDVGVPLSPEPVSAESVVSSVTIDKNPVRKYRTKLILIGLAFFILSVVASSVYILLGRNTISGSNISLSVTGPFTIGGGEVLPLQVGIANHNNVTIETATVVVQYPAGTRSSEGEGTDLYSERIPVEAIAAGENRNIPLRARVFGEENQESEVKVSIEYRVQGSSATFYKEADPLRFKISHAPVTIKVDSVRSISSGQEVNLKLNIVSNSSSPIYDLVVKADYPSTFSYTRSEPNTSSGRNIWHISELKPESSTTIDLYGTFSGSASDKYTLKFSAGVASGRNPNELASVLAVASTEFTLENPFLSTSISIDGKSDESVSVAPGSQSNVVLEVKNNSAATVYDASVVVKLSGNALVDSQVSASNGYYDSNTRTIRFDRSTASRLSKLDPGASERLSFNLRPTAGNAQSPQILIEVSAAGRRVSESNSREEVSGALKRTIKVEGRMAVSGRIADVTGGTVPLVVGRSASYRIALDVENSGNATNGAIVTATLPAYMEWVGEGAGDGTWSYNSTTRTVEWRAGNISSGAKVSGTFGVSILPSSSLTGRTPMLVENISLRADDTFTGSVVRGSGGSISAELPNQRGSGNVSAN